MSKGCNLLVVIAAIIAIVLSITGCGKSLDEKIPDSFINETLEFALTIPCQFQVQKRAQQEERPSKIL